jgi:hypothetical protein
MLCLALKNDEAIEWVNWCLHIGQLDSNATRFLFMPAGTAGN